MSFDINDLYISTALFLNKNKRERKKIVLQLKEDILYIETKKNKTFVAKKSNTFDEVKNVGCKVVQPLPDDLYCGLHKMLSSPSALEAAGKNLRRLILQKYTWKKTAEKYLSISDSICQ